MNKLPTDVELPGLEMPQLLLLSNLNLVASIEQYLLDRLRRFLIEHIAFKDNLYSR